MKYYPMCWSELVTAAEQLAKEIKPHCINDIIAIARGGLIPACLINQHLNIRRIHSFGIEYYNDKDKMKHPIIYQEVTIGFFQTGKKILVVDDIADSGASLDLAVKHLIHRGVEKENILTCTIHYKPKSIHKPNMFYKEINDNTWVEYPFEKNNDQSVLKGF